MDTIEVAFGFGVGIGFAIGAVCAALGAHRERRRQRYAASRAIADAYGAGWSQGRLSVRTVTLGPEIETAECPTDEA